MAGTAKARKIPIACTISVKLSPASAFRVLRRQKQVWLLRADTGKHAIGLLLKPNQSRVTCHVPHVFLFVAHFLFVACATKRTKIDWPMRPCTLRHTCSVSTTTTALETTSRRTRRAASAFRCCSTRLAPSPPRDTELGATARASPNTGDSNCSWRQRCRAHPWSVITKESAHWRDSLRAERLPAQQNRCAVNFVTTGQARPVGACGACRRREDGRLAHLNARKLRHLVGT